MYKIINESGIPRWLKFLIDLVLTITVVYWLFFLIYKGLDLLRMFLHVLTEKKLFWVAVGIMLTCGVVVMVYLEIATDVKPFTNVLRQVKSWWDFGRDFIAGEIHS